MLDSHVGLGAQLTALMTGLADQKIKEGDTFLYGGGRLYADDVAQIALPCALVLADAVSRSVGLGGCGYEFELGESNPIFPVHAKAVQPRAFMIVGPVLTEVFENVIYPLRNDLSQVYALAVRQMGWVLEDDLDPRGLDVIPGALLEHSSPRASAPALGLGR